MATSPSWLSAVVMISRAILHDRKTRRKWLGNSVIFMLCFFAIGLWGIDGWLKGSIVRFGLWWAGCGVIAMKVMIFALYDAVACIREEREKNR
jgi:quinol-cytochrome oxidoreductase complex cytochrome b subunit